MRAELETLLKLQEIDQEIKKLEAEKAQAPARLSALKENLTSKDAGLKQFTERLSEIKKRRVDIEDELEVENVRLGKSQQKLNSIKTNREYQALLKEIEEIKKANKSREDEIVTAMEETDAVENDIKARQVEADGIQKEIEVEETHLARIESELDGRISALEDQRQTITKDARQDLLSRYQFLRDKRGGVAIVSVTNAVCNGCHMNIPPQLFNELLRDEKIHYCPICQRLIYTENSGQDAC